jgi:hypothetical protein
MIATQRRQIVNGQGKASFFKQLVNGRADMLFVRQNRTGKKLSFTITGLTL